jgi:hypothetical protein
MEDGIFFPDDSVILLSGSPRAGYTASARMELSLLLETDPEGWTELMEHLACCVEAGGIIATAGGGAWEGDGFVAALRASDGALLWVLHLEGAEVFSELRHDGDIIEAVSSEWPDEYRWRIPLSSPWELSVIARRAI